MERLPYEIQLEIFSKLPTTDRLSSLFVSKAWNKAAKTCAFKDVTIRDQKKLTSAITYFDENTNFANQVINLEIDDCKNTYQYLPRLPQLFANVNDFRVRLADPQTGFDPKATSTLGWKKLEYIGTHEPLNENTPLVLELVLSGYCPNLSNVFAEFNCGDASDDTEIKHCRRVINLLMNAPQLTTLEFSHLHCTVNDLETLHQNTPNLRTLILSLHAEITPTDTSIKAPNLEKIVAKYAENTLTYLDILEVFTFLRHLEITYFTSIVCPQRVPQIYAIFDFIGKKYWGLEFLSITCNTEHGDEENLEFMRATFDQGAIERRLLPLFARCPGLTHYDQIFSPLSSAVTYAMDISTIQLKKTALYVDEITMEDQLQALFGSQQPRYIEDLSIYQLDEPDFIVQWPSPQFAQMINLKKLHLEGRNGKICFTELIRFLKHCSHLEELELHNTTLYSTEVDTDLPVLALQSLSISRLKIESMLQIDIVETILKKILSHCPKLEDIYFDWDFGINCKPEEDTKPFTFTLDFRTHTNLKTIDIGVRDATDHYYIESPMMTGYFYDCYKTGKRFVRTDPSQPGEYYTTILISHPVNLMGTTIE